MSDNPHGLVLPPELDPRGRPRPRPRWMRVLKALAVLTSFSVLLVSGVGYGLYRHYDGNIDRVLLRIGGKRPPRLAGKALNVLLVGSDSRADMSKEELKRAATEFTPGRRSDTVILVHVSGNRDHVTLVSFPRDAYVTIPAHGRTPEHKGKLNTAFSLGGPALTIQMIERLTDVRIDHYVEVNFAGFQRIVEAVDGVDVCLRKAAKEPLSGINLPAGRSRIRGHQALAFVRQREGLPRGDLDRIERQQQFLGALMRRATSTGVLLNPVKLNRFLDTTTDSIQVDQDLGFGEMRTLALALRNLDPARVAFVTAPVAGLARRNGQSVVLLDEAAGMAMFQSIARDEPLAKPPAALPKRLTVKPSEIRVTVLNGTGVRGRAANAANDLREVGFRVAGTGNAEGAAFERTTVRYAPGQEAAAATLAASLHGARTEVVRSESSTLTVVVGRDYREPATVKVDAPSSPAPRPSRSATQAPVATAADDVCAK